MRALKIAGIVVGGLIGLVVLAAVAILLLVNPNDYRDDIEKLARAADRSPAADPRRSRAEAVSVDRPRDQRRHARQSAGLWQRAVPDRDEREGRREAAAAAPQGSAGPQGVGGRPVRHPHQPQRRREQLEGPGRLGARSSPNRRPSSGAKATIAGVDVTNATLIYRDEAKKSVTRLSGLEIHTGALGGSDPVDADVKFDYDDGGPARVAHIETKARILMPPDSSRIEVQKLDAKADWFGTPTGDKPAKPLALTVSAPSLVLDTKAETLAPATLDIKVGDLPVKLYRPGREAVRRVCHQRQARGAEDLAACI